MVKAIKMYTLCAHEYNPFQDKEYPEYVHGSSYMHVNFYITTEDPLED